MTARFLNSRPIGLLLLLLLQAGCSDVSGPGSGAIEIAMLSGDGQFATSGGELAEPLTVMVRRVESGQPVADVIVRWDVVAGEGVVLDQGTTTTDSMGQGSVNVRLGEAFGSYSIEADFTGRSGQPSRFELFVVPSPEILEMPDAAVAGETIRIEGRHFRPAIHENLVLFAGFRGEVLSGNEDELMVRVPSCLPTRGVDVSVAFGPAVQGAPRSLQVEAQGEPLQLLVGQSVVINDPAALTCLRIASGESARYLAVPHSTSVILGSSYSFGLRGLPGAVTPVAAADAREGTLAAQALHRPQQEEASSLSQVRWDHALRKMEQDLLPLRQGERPAGPQGKPMLSQGAAPPQLGSRREFNVLNSNQDFDRVTAEVVHVGQHALLYQDITAPEGGFTVTDFADFAADFDQVSYPTVTDIFGQPSDLDGNGRIIILFTPQVNRLTPAGSSSFIGGFFFGLDLLQGRPGSNEGEIFYTLVPDPQGAVGDARTTAQVRRAVPAILAHEFQHMVHFNERVLVRGQPNTEALWLSEGLAQMAEDLVGDVFADRGDTEMTINFRNGNFQRARRYLENPGSVSLVPISGGGTLEERGAGWLFVRYLRGQAGGGNQLLRALTQSTQAGVANVQTQTGRAWSDLLGSWSAAMYLSGLGVPIDPRLDFTDIDLRAAIVTPTGSYPLQAPLVGPGEFLQQGSLQASSPRYFLIRPGTGGTAVTIAGPTGLPAVPSGRLALTIVRLQ